MSIPASLLRKPTSRSLTAVVLASACLFGLGHPAPVDAGAGGAKPTKLKFATLAPEGTPWMDAAEDTAKEVKKRTNGDVRFRFYPGGVLGDEAVILRRMKVGQIQMAGFTGVGLGEILPEARLMELPFIYHSYAELDYVRERIRPEIAKRLLDKGFVLLGWNDTGFVQLYSRSPLSTLEQFRGTKVWVWEGDPLAHSYYSSAGVKPTPLALPDVLTSLQTGLVDTVYNSALGLISLQWQTKVKYHIDLTIGNGSGAILITKKAWDGLSEDHQQILETASNKHGSKLIQTIREKNREAAETLRREGIETVAVAAEELEKFRQIGMDVSTELAGKLYDKAMFDRVMALIQEFRAQSESGK